MTRLHAFIALQKDRFIVESFSKAIALDGLGSSHPVKVNVNSPAEIGEIFDAISYTKVSMAGSNQDLSPNGDKKVHHLKKWKRRIASVVNHQSFMETEAKAVFY